MENSHHGNTAAPWGFATFVNISMRSVERKAGDRREQTQQIPTVDVGHQREQQLFMANINQQAAGMGVLLFKVEWKTVQSASLLFGV